MIAALYVIVWLAGYLSQLIVPMAIALLLAALMAPGVDRLVQWGVPRWAATVIVMIAGIAVLGGLLTFLLQDGPGIWRFVTRAVPAQVRDRVDVAGRRGFAALVNYVRATAAVALVDAVGIGIGLAIIGVPLVIPLSALVFLSAFVPIIGGIVAGTVAVLVALVAKGFIAALIYTKTTPSPRQSTSCMTTRANLHQPALTTHDRHGAPLATGEPF